MLIPRSRPRSYGDSGQNTEGDTTMFRHRGIRRALAPAIVLLLLAGVAACGDDDDDSATGGGGGGGDSLQIALLLPETKTARYETQDRPLFEAKVEDICDE